MSKEAFLRFRDTVMASGQLQAELVNGVKSQADLLAVARKLGFDVEAADLQSRELTEEELSHVAGGTLTLGGSPTLGGSLGSKVSFVSHEKWIDVAAFNSFLGTFK